VRPAGALELLDLFCVPETSSFPLCFTLRFYVNLLYEVVSCVMAHRYLSAQIIEFPGIVLCFA
jgi:hypothetical protein